MKLYWGRDSPIVMGHTRLVHASLTLSSSYGRTSFRAKNIVGAISAGYID